VTNKFGKVNVGEEAVEPEPETADLRAPEAPGGTSPPRIARGTRPGPGGDGGGRREKRGASSASFLTRISQFVRDTRAEMRRVSWPTANEVKNTTIITLIAVIFFAIYLFGIDRIWSFLIEHLRTWLGG
jgi:preprotein translocase subunit SecE